MPNRPAAKTRSSGRALKWLRRGRPVFVVFWAGLVTLLGWAALEGSGSFKVPRYQGVPVFETAVEELKKLEGRLLDTRFRWRGEEPPHPDVVLVAIDEAVLSDSAYPAEAYAKSPALRAMTEGYQESWRHVVWAEAIDRLVQFGAKVIVFDVVFQRKSSEVPRVERLIGQMKAEGHALPEERLLVIAARDSTHFRETVEKHISKIVLGMSLDIEGRVLKLRLPHPTLAPEDFENLLGNVQVPFDNNEPIQRVVVHRWIDDAYFLDVKGLDALAVHKFNGTTPVEEGGHPIRFQGPKGTYKPTPLAALFVEDPERSGPTRGGEAFRDKIVYIGATYELAHDDKNTPFGIMPGVEVHTNIAGDLLTGSRLKRISGKSALWIIIAMVLLPVAVVLFIRLVLIQALSLLALIGAYTFLCHIAFSRWDLILPMASGLVAPSMIGVGTVYAFFLEQREKAHLRKVFNRFVSEKIASVVLKHAEEVEQARHGEKRPVAVLFSDIRSFTTWSEEAPPEHLVGQLNEYFERMVKLIEEDSGGNVQKFIGDAILAAWGDTHSNGYGEDCRRAVSSALAMRAALRELNLEWTGRTDRREISTGIGINHGDVIVGVVGPFLRSEYTALGDGVNFAARLESATKQFHTDILVGESVEALTREKFVFRHVDFVRVKGKTQPVNIFIPLSDSAVSPPEWLTDYHRARALYVERRFGEAAELFGAVMGRIGAEDFLCEMYLERCAAYTRAAPAADWDGSYTMTEK